MPSTTDIALVDEWQSAGQLPARKRVSADEEAPEQGDLLIFPRSFAPGAKNPRRESPQGDTFSPRVVCPRSRVFGPIISGPGFPSLTQPP